MQRLFRFLSGYYLVQRVWFYVVILFLLLACAVLLNLYLQPIAPIYVNIKFVPL